ncbi:hypothetical protein [Methanobrevibacter sp. DSM 116169]|uniref:hypothetical protein n=1 Tax=Methanobrevibacter sp. DSM 116169 TaxID=3242727 RepID=UPI0038FC604D
MVKYRDYDPFSADLPVQVKEGDIEVREAIQSFGKDNIWIIGDEIKKGDYVTIDNTEEEFTVKKAGASDTVYGRIIDEPRFEGTRPIESTDAGDYQMRIATVRLFGVFAPALKLQDTNAVIKAGDSIAYAGDNLFKKATGTTTNVALEGAAANTGKKIMVLTGFNGI